MTTWQDMATANQTQNLGDGYEVKGKMTSKTGGSTAKAKAQPKGYKGTTVTGDPSKDKSESTVSVTSSDSGDDKAKSVSTITQIVEEAQIYEQSVSEEKWNLNNAGSLQNANIMAYQAKGAGAGFYYAGNYYTAPSQETYQHMMNVRLQAENTAKAQEKAASVADLQAEVTANAQLEGSQKAESVADLQAEVTSNALYEGSKKEASVADLQLEADINTGWEKAVAEQSLQQEVYDNQAYEQSLATTTTPISTTVDENSEVIYLNDSITTADWGKPNDSSFTLDKENPSGDVGLSTTELVTINSMRTGFGQRTRRDQYILLGDVFNTVKLAPVFDGLKITGAKFNVNIPLFRNKRGTRFQIGG